jgi:hypothetical protein
MHRKFTALRCFLYYSRTSAEYQEISEIFARDRPVADKKKPARGGLAVAGDRAVSCCRTCYPLRFFGLLCTDERRQFLQRSVPG